MKLDRAGLDDIEALHALVEGAYRGESAKRGWTHEADLLGGQRTDLIAYYERRGYSRTGEHRPFPHDDPRFGRPKSPELEFAVLRKSI